MKVLLVQPPWFGTGSDRVFQPLSLAYLAASCREKEISDITIYDGFLRRVKNNFSPKEAESDLKRILLKDEYDLVGISNPYQAFSDDAIQCASYIKSIRNIPIVMGGTHATVCYKELLKEEHIDYIVIGEGELTFPGLVKKIEVGNDVKKVDGLAYKVGEKVFLTKPRELIRDLDAIPFPARDLLEMNDYFSLESKIWNMRLPKAAMISSRGCVGQCIYCSAHQVWGGRIWRGRSPKNVVDELEHLVKKYGVREIDFEDDQIATDPRRLELLCEEILKRNLDIKWKTPAGIGHWSLNKKILKLMKKSGYYRATFGIESATPRIRKFIRKTHDIQQAKEVINHAHDLGLWTNATFIVGFPDETLEEIMVTYNWFDSSQLDYGNFYLPAVHPGTELHDYFIRNNLSINPEISKYASISGYKTSYFSEVELRDLVLKLQKNAEARIIRRFMNPKNIIRKIHSIEDLKYVIRLILFYTSSVIRNKLKIQGS